MFDKTLSRVEHISTGPQTGLYLLTPSQQRMWIIHRLNRESTAYNSPVVRKITGHIQLPALKAAFLQLIARHEQLRAGFTLLNDVPVQFVHPVPHWDLTCREGIREADIPAEIDRFIRPFDLQQPPLLRACLLCMDTGNEYTLLTDMHHIISDLASEDILIRDLFALYHGAVLPSLPALYSGYASRLQEQYADGSMHPAEHYWKEQLQGELPLLELPVDFPRPPVFNFEGSILHTPFPAPLAAAIRSMAAQQHTSVSNVCMAALLVLLHRYTRQEDIIVGTPREIRPDEDTRNIIGLFINTLPVRAFPAATKTFRQLLQEVSTATTAAAQHFQYDVGLLVEQLCTTRDPARNPLYDVLFFHHKIQTEYTGHLQVAPLSFVHHKAEVDLTLGLTEWDQELGFSIEYYSGIFKPATIQQMVIHYQRILEAVTANPDLCAGEVPMLTPAETTQQLTAFQRSGVPAPPLTLHRLFEAQAAASPDHPALSCNGTILTYRRLNERANQLARVLQRHGAGAGTITGILLGPSEEMIIAILAILKTGSAYLPLDIGLPPERARLMLADAGVTCLLTLPALVHDGHRACRIIDVSDMHILQEEPTNPACAEDPNANAYIIFTSGSTGIPKGTMVRHYNVVHTVLGENAYKLLPDDRLLQLSDYAFDATVFDIFGTLLRGATLVLAEAAARQDVYRIAALLQEERITVAFMTTALFNTMVDNVPASLLPLRLVLTGGEQVSVPHMKKALALTGKGKLLHMYGPTEGTIFSTCYPVNEIPEEAHTVPIGFPLSNVRLYVLNGNTLMPRGAAGELCIGGDGVAAGYLDAARTQERFVQDPFEPGRIMYRTGDIVKWQENGALVFMGREDEQVKIRGYRIETAEIDLQLRKHPGVKDTLIMVKDKQLYACYIPAAGVHVTPEILRGHLTGLLPAYMIPAVFVALPAFPLTLTGKVDRKKLAILTDHAGEITDTDLRPLTPAEKKLSQLWGILLKKEPAGVHRNFFECGGHSLTATLLANHIQQAFGVVFPPSEVFRHPTVAAQAACLENLQRQPAPAIQPMARRSRRHYFPLSFSEAMVFVHQHMGRDNHSYHSVFPMTIKGAVDPERLETAIRQVIQRHEIFRSGYMLKKGQPVKKVYSDAAFTLTCREGSAVDIPAILAELRVPYALDKPPLFRATLLQLATDHYFLAFANHHIGSDGVTEMRLMQEISGLYQGKTLPAVTLQYTDFTAWQQAQWAAGYYKPAETWWLQQLQGTLPVLQLPLDRPRPPQFSFAGDSLRLTAGRELTQQLYALAATEQTTLFVLLFSAWQVLLHKYTGQQDIITGVPMANRPHAGQQDIPGMFVNMVPWRCFPMPEQTFLQLLTATKVAAAAVYRHQEYPFEKLVSALQLPRDPSRNPLFDTIFVLQSTGQPLFHTGTVQAAVYPAALAATKADLMMEIQEDAGDIVLMATWSTALFEAGSIQRLLFRFRELLHSIVQHPRQTLKTLEMLSGAELQELHGFNPPATTYPKHLSLYSILQTQVRLHPDKTALRAAGTAITYRQLHDKAAVYASRLLEMGLQPGQPVALLLPRSPEMIIAIIGVLQAGGAYVPIDPDYPEARIQYMLHDSGAGICITTFDLFANSNIDAEVLIADRDEEVTTVPDIPAVGTGESPAYIMYTSGSTGMPKGTRVLQYSVLRTVINPGSTAITVDDTVLQLSAFTFDGSVYDILGALLNGATLVLAQQQDIVDAARLTTLIRDHGITVLFIPTALFNACIDIDPACFAPLRKVLFGGEQASIAHVKKALDVLGPDKLLHVYGPTETTVFTTAYPVQAISETGMLPIGRPLANTTAYVMGDSNSLHPVGIPGELYVGGDGVSEGYLNNPALSAEKFIPSPFVPGERLYRTGDIVQWLPDGNLAFIGRKDHQVKVRGYRIEPGEIEVLLGRHPGIRQCVVVPAPGRLQLYAFYTTESELTETDLRKYLVPLLPAYMLPDRFIRMEELPLTSNGKIDRKALAVAGKPPEQAVSAFAPPATRTEQLLSGIWADVFGLQRVGVHDNFYALGGHSLQALQVVHRLQKNGYAISVSELFSYPTVRELASKLPPKSSRRLRKKDSLVAGMPFPLSAVQARFFQRPLLHRHIFNSPYLIALEQTYEPAAIQAALEEMRAGHPALTLYFIPGENGQWQQAYARAVPGDFFTRTDLSSLPAASHDATIAAECEAWQSRFSITTGPLFRAVLFENYRLEGRQVLFLLFYHLTFDGVSWQIFTDELRQRCTGRRVATRSGTAYHEWCNRLQAYAHGTSFTMEHAWWQQQLQRGRSFLPDHPLPRAPLQREMAYHVTTVLSSGTAMDTLYAAVSRYQANTFHLLLAAFYAACKAMQERDNLLVYIMTAQRESFFKDIDLEKTIGFFAGAYPVCITEGQERTDMISAVKDALLAVPRAGLDYFVLQHLVPGTTLTSEAPVLFHFLNLMPSSADNTFYKPLPLPTGLTHSPDNPSAYVLNITVTLEPDRLKMTCYYSSAHFKESTIHALAEGFSRQLQTIIYPKK